MFKTIFISIICLTISGCLFTSKEGAAPGIRINSNNAPYARIQMDSVVILDRSLQEQNGPGKLAIESHGTRLSSSGVTEAIALIRNRTDYELQIEVRVSFFDEQKIQSERTSAWRRLFLEPNSYVSYKEASLSTVGVKHYLIEIREAK